MEIARPPAIEWSMDVNIEQDNGGKLVANVKIQDAVVCPADKANTLDPNKLIRHGDLILEPLNAAETHVGKAIIWVSF